MVVIDICNHVKYFYACSFNFARRSCNKAAHTMAKNSLAFEEDLISLQKNITYLDGLVSTLRGKVAMGFGARIQNLQIATLYVVETNFDDINRRYLQNEDTRNPRVRETNCILAKISR